MKVGRFAAPLQHSVLALVIMSVAITGALAQDSHSHSQKQTKDQQAKASVLVQTVRQATARFKDVSVAQGEGYALQFGCVSGDSEGAMGLHFVNGALVGSGVIDATKPQIVIYEAQPDGSLKLIGADFLVMAKQWNATHPGPPELMGQLFHLFDSPNRFGLPAFYTLHVWAWKDNPNGAFVNWHPNVSCETFNDLNP
jgi:hypothetical protein